MQVYCIHVIDMLHLNITNMDEKKCTLYILQTTSELPSRHTPRLNEDQIINIENHPQTLGVSREKQAPPQPSSSINFCILAFFHLKYDILYA